MSEQIKAFLKGEKKETLPDIRPGDTVRVYQRIKEAEGAAKKTKEKAKEKKERPRVFDGLVLAQKHGRELGATLLVRKMISGVGVEITFPLHSPLIEKIEVIKRGRARRAKLYYLRKRKGKQAEVKKRKA